MDQRDREKIDVFCSMFLPKINIYRLFPCLLEFGVYNDDDVNVPVWQENLGDPETVRDIVETIKTRGPFAFQNLVRSLRKVNHNDLADALEGRAVLSCNNNVPNNVDNLLNNGTDNLPWMEDEYHKYLQKIRMPLQIKVRKSTTFLDGPDYQTIGRYPMRTRPHGYVLIITIITYIDEKKRDAAEWDEANLKKLFEGMGFEVTTYTDLTGADIKRVVKEFSERKDFYKVSSSFVIISAHGAEAKVNDSPDTEIQGIDYQDSNAEKVYCTDIIDYFSAERCDQLVGKPKIFIFQTCRGELEQYPVRTAADGKLPSYGNRMLTRNYSDMLVAHATMPGYKSYRDTINGSWYIQIMCEVFMNYACEMHIQDLFNMVDRRLMDLRTHDDKAQTSTYKSIGFNKHCFLNPGLFEDP